MIFLDRFLKFFSSLKLAVIIIIGIAVISAVGTIYEAKYDALYAQTIVYRSSYMYFILGLLCINLIFVMIDRWPWKLHHMGFVFAHIGIILTLGGALMTQLIGLDGTLSFGEGQRNQFVILPETEVALYSTFEGDRYANLYRRPTNFLVDPPTKNPITIDAGEESFKITDYYHYAMPRESWKASDDKNDGPVFRIQLQNSRAHFVEWVFRDKLKKSETISLGPAKITVTSEAPVPADENEIFLRPEGEKISYLIYNARTKAKIKGLAKIGDEVETGWMDLRLRFLNFLPQAKREVIYEKREQPTPATTSAIKIEYKGQDHWLGLNALSRFFTPDRVYVISYGNRRIDLGFGLKLERFNIGHYPGTSMASSYESVVEVDGYGGATISMNDPLKFKGYTFYQASFEQDAMGKPVASVLSVNKDPGRWIKYLGSLLIVLGAILLFYFKRAKFLRGRKPNQA